MIDILIIGDKGFLGRALIKSFVNESKVRLIKYSQFKNNIEDENFSEELKLKIKNYDDFYIINAAGSYDELNPSKMFRSNYGLVNDIVKLAHLIKIRKFIQVSSIGVYKKINKGVISESSPLEPCNIYEMSKLMADNLLITNSKAMNILIVRPSNIVGREMKSGWMKSLLKSVKQNMFFYFDNKDAVINYIDVDDLSDIIKYLTLNDQDYSGYKIINISHNIQLKAFIEIAKEFFNKSSVKTLNVKQGIVYFIIKLIPESLIRLPLNQKRFFELNKSVVFESEQISNLDLIHKSKNIKKIIEILEK